MTSGRKKGCVPWNKGLKGFRIGENLGNRNGNWKSDKVSNDGLHAWVIRSLGKPKNCDHCGTRDIKKRYDWANISGEYKRANGLGDWLRLCRTCHKIFDNQCGENHKCSKLTNQNVLQIREQWKSKGFTMKELSVNYGVSVTTISAIVNFKKWRHI